MGIISPVWYFKFPIGKTNYIKEYFEISYWSCLIGVCSICVVQKSCDVVESCEAREIDIDPKDSGIVQWQSKGYIIELGIVQFGILHGYLIELRIVVLLVQDYFIPANSSTRRQNGNGR